MRTLTEHLLMDLKRIARFARNEAATYPGFWYMLGKWREARGNVPGAIANYTHALELADRSSNRRMFRIRHKWQYELERAYHRAGRARVHDPLFACTAAPDIRTLLPPKILGKAPGHFEAEWWFRGLRIDGYLAYAHPPGTVVRVLLNGALLRTLTVTKAPMTPPYFQLTIQRHAVAKFHLLSSLRLELADGRALAFDGCENTLIQVPHGAGDPDGQLEAGNCIDKKGFLVTLDEDLHERQARYLEIYARARDVFEQEFGTPLFLLYGTLLGFYREGDFIRGDDDFDVGYFSRQGTVAEIKQQAMRFVVQLVAAGLTVSFNRDGRLFRLRLPSSRPDSYLDVHTVWCENGSTWIHPRARLDCSIDDFLPATQSTLRGVCVNVPARPEAFLRAYYGADWKIPNPVYSTTASRIARSVRRHLARAFITPADHCIMQQELRELDNGGAGRRLISIGSHSLYPLTDYEANCDW